MSQDSAWALTALYELPLRRRLSSPQPRLAQGNYPESLDALAPRFIESLPHDVIGGQPLKYHRTDNGQFALYSVGWNGTDDGRAVVLRNYSNGSIVLEKGDWVWTGHLITIQK